MFSYFPAPHALGRKYPLRAAGLFLLAFFASAATSALAGAGNTAAQYRSIYSSATARTFTKDGVTKRFFTVGYKDTYNYISTALSSATSADPGVTGADVAGIIGCSLNIANYPGCNAVVSDNGLTSMDFGNGLLNTLNFAKGDVERDQAHVKIWLPAGTIALPLSIFTTQQAQTQFLARLDAPPQGSFPKDITRVSAGSSLASLLAGQEAVGYNTPGGGSFQFSYFGDVMTPLPAGRWLYMDWYLPNVGYDGSPVQLPIGLMNGNIGLKNDLFKAEYKRQLDCGAFDSVGDPVVLSGSACTALPASLPAPVIGTANTSTVTTSILISGSQDASAGSAADPVRINLYVDGVLAGQAAVSASTSGASWSQTVSLPTLGTHTIYAVAVNSQGTSLPAKAITVSRLSDGGATPANFGARIDATNASLQGLTLSVASGDAAKRVALFVGILVDKELYFVTPGGLVSYRDLQAKYAAGTIGSASVYLATTTTGSFVYDVLPTTFKNVDLTKLVPIPGSNQFATIQVFAGYGVVNSDADLLVNFNGTASSTDALTTMLANGTLQSILK